MARRGYDGVALAVPVTVPYVRHSIRGAYWFLGQALRRLCDASGLNKDQFDGLTARERDIAALIAQGKSNKEIAEGLSLSNRTVEAHISRILPKLNFSSRSQIAVWAVEKGLLKN